MTANKTIMGRRKKRPGVPVDCSSHPLVFYRNTGPFYRKSTGPNTRRVAEKRSKLKFTNDAGGAGAPLNRLGLSLRWDSVQKD